MSNQTSIIDLTDKNDVRDKFLGALLKLMETKPYSEISIKEICSFAGLSRRTFYNNFTEKDDLLNHLAEDLVLGFHVTDDFSGIRHIFNYWYELRNIVSLLIENNLWDSISYKISKIYTPLLAKRNWNKLLGDYANSKDYFFSFIDAGISRLIYIWHADNFTKTPDELTGLVEQILDKTFLKMQ